MRIHIERWTLIVLLAASYLSRVPGLIRQGAVGVPALIVGFVISAVLIALLLRSSAKAALLIAVFASLGGILAPLGQLLIMPMMTGAARPPFLQVGLSLGISVIVALCALDLWSRWKKEPNQSLQPTAPSGRG